MRTDAEIKQAVLHELKWDTHVDDAHVAVGVDQGVVTLTGRVPSWAQRVAAQKAAHRIAGVLDVANDLLVRPQATLGHSDTEIAQAVRSALKWSVFVPDTRITSTVSDGRVTLEGEVDYLAQREDAEKAVRNLAGVCGVINAVQVIPPRAVAPSDVRSAIAAALERRTEREVGRIHLDVQDGRVTVSGTVHTWAEHETVLGAAKGTPGVRSIDDQLRIEP
ncbi:MAG TPA: BON domain-containing protein [Polyangiaceae bacterium]|nr:BON domain-containing protein [Polyangiaceae bacterium]